MTTIQQIYDNLLALKNQIDASQDLIFINRNLITSECTQQLKDIMRPCILSASDFSSILSRINDNTFIDLNLNSNVEKTESKQKTTKKSKLSDL